MKMKGRFWLNPKDAHEPLEQHGLLLASTPNCEVAVKLRGSLLGFEAQAILEKFGYFNPPPSATNNPAWNSRCCLSQLVAKPSIRGRFRSRLTLYRHRYKLIAENVLRMENARRPASNSRLGD
jgi:hypothetical protein